MENTKEIIDAYKNHLKSELKTKEQVIEHFFGNELYLQLHSVESLIDSIVDGRYISVKRMKFENNLRKK